MTDTARSAETTGPVPAAPHPRRVRVSHAALVMLRIAIATQVAALLLQSLSAGGLLEGGTASFSLHAYGAVAVHITGALQLIAAVAYLRLGEGPLWPALVGALLLLAGFTQAALGSSVALAVHVPLGTALFGGAAAMLAWALTTRPRAENR